MKTAKNTVTSDSDDIPSFLLRDTAYVLSNPLTGIFSFILETSTSSELWKLAQITPIHKKADTSQIISYRLLRNFSKVFEWIFYTHI